MAKKPEKRSPRADETTLAALTADPNNARKHTPRNIGMLVDALHEVGAARSIVVDEHGVILAGNATVEAAAEAGITKLKIIDADGDTVIAVRRSGLTDQQKARLALFDNRVAELAEWDTATLQRLDEIGVPLTNLFYDEELSALLKPDPTVAAVPFGGLASPTGSGGGTTSADDENFVAFKFGDYSGRIARVVYNTFAARVLNVRGQRGPVTLDDILNELLS